MGRRSTRADKNIYQQSREHAGLTRQEAGFRMDYVSEDRIEKIESGKSEVRPEEVLAMAHCYHDATLCNQHCSRMCPIGRQYVTSVSEKPLPQIAIEVVNAITKLYAERDKLIELASREEFPDDAMDELIGLSIQLNHLDQSSDSLKLWVQKEMKGI